MNTAAIPFTPGVERNNWLESLAPVPEFHARDLWEAKRTPETKHVDLHLHALMAHAWLTEDAPFSQSRGCNTAMISGWISDDQRVSVLIAPDRHEVEVRAERHGTECVVRVLVPGEILGAPIRERYRGIFFSLTRGERHANLYDLLEVAATGLVIALDLVDLKLGKKTSPAWAVRPVPSWRERDLPATPVPAQLGA